MGCALVCGSMGVPCPLPCHCWQHVPMGHLQQLDRKPSCDWGGLRSALAMGAAFGAAKLGATSSTHSVAGAAIICLFKTPCIAC